MKVTTARQLDYLVVLARWAREAWDLCAVEAQP